MIYNRIPITFGAFNRVTGPQISYQYDVVQYLVFEDLELPAYYEVDFCNEGDSTSITIVGTEDGVRIPDNFMLTGKKVKAYVVVQGEDEGAVETRYEVTLPVRKRAARTDVQPTPAQQLQIDELIDALDGAADGAEDARDKAEAAVSHYPKIENDYWYVWDAENEEWVNTEIRAAGQDGVSPTIAVSTIPGGHRVTITDAAYPLGQAFDVMDGSSDAGGVTYSDTATYDSGTVGSELKEQKNAVEAIEEIDKKPIPFTVDGNGYISYTTGEVGTSSVSSHTDYIDLSGFGTISYKCQGSMNSSVTAGAAFYDANKTFISGISAKRSQAATGYVSDLEVISVPQNAVYARFSVYTDTTTYGEFEIYGNNNPNGKIFWNNIPYAHADVLNESLLATKLEAPSNLNENAFGSYSYWDVFVKNNKISNGSSTDGTYSPATINAGSPKISSNVYCSKGYSLKCFGGSSTQVKWAGISLTKNHRYMMGCRVRVDRYVTGNCGVSISYDNSIASVSRVTDGFEFVSAIILVSSNVSSANLFAGTLNSADADCYVDDVFLLDITELFSNLDLSEDANKYLVTEKIFEAQTDYISILNGLPVCKKKLYERIKPKFVSAVLETTSDDTRFIATWYLLKIAERKLNGIDTSAYEKRLARYTTKAAVCVLPENPGMYEQQALNVIYSNNGDVSAVPASVTKVASVITALPYITSIKNKVTIASEDITSGSGNVFQAGDVVTVEDLLYAMMLPSSNTAAIALGHYVGKIILENDSASASDCKAAFVEQMATEMAKIGCTGTAFADPSGVNSSGYATCNDLLKIGVAAASFDILNRIWAKDAYTINVTGTNARTINLSTTVKAVPLESDYIILGGKTGSLTGISPEAHALLVVTEPK